MRKVGHPSVQTQITLTALSDFLEVASAKGIRAAFGTEGEKKGNRALGQLHKAFTFSMHKHRSNPLVLTEAGHELVKITREFFDTLSKFEDKYLNTPPTIVIGAGDSIIHWLVLPAIRDLLQKQSKVRFSVRMGGTKGLLQFLRGSEMDFAIVPANAEFSRKWKSESIGTYQYCICYPRSILKVRLNDVELSKLEFAMIHDHWQLNFQKKASSAGLKLNVRAICETFTHVASLIETESFAGILPVPIASSFPKEKFGCDMLKFMEGTNSELKLVWKNEETPHLEVDLADFVQPVLSRLRDHLRLSQALERIAP